MPSRPFVAITAGSLACFSAAAEPVNVNVVVTPAAYSGCSDAAAEWMDIASCPELSSAPVGGGAFAWVVVTDEAGFPAGIGSMSFGVEHTGGVLDFTLCTGGLQISSVDWPSSGTGTAVTWGDGCHEPVGASARVGHFLLSDGNAGAISLVEDPRTGDASWNDCTPTRFDLCSAHLGAVDLGIGATPTCGDVGGPPPAPVTDVDATSGTCEIPITWSHDGIDVNRFRIVRNAKEIAVVGRDEREFVDVDPPAGVPVAYSVVALNHCAEADASEVAVATMASDVPPATSCEASLEECHAVRVNWDHVGGADLFSIERDGVEVGMSGGGSREYFDASIERGVTYTYRLVAIGCAPATPSNEAIGGAVFSPLEPAGLAADASDCDGQVTLTWIDRSTTETEFVVERGPIGGALEAIATVEPDTELFVDDTASPSSAFSYRVRSVNPCGSSTAAPSVDAVTLGVPAPATNCDVDAACAAMHVTWVDESDNEEGFDVLRNDVVIATLDAGVEAFVDVDVDVDVPYTYAVVARSACGHAAPSNEATGQVDEAVEAPVLSSPPDAAQCVPQAVAWDPVDGATSYVVEYGVSCDALDHSLESIDTGAWLTLAGPAAWRVRAVDACGTLHEPSQCWTLRSPVTLPPPPTFDAVQKSDVLWRLEWSPVADADHYLLDIHGLDEVLIELNDTEYLVDQADPDWMWGFTARVAAVDVCGRVGVFSDWRGPGGGVPVQLESFDATVHAESVDLSWRATNEPGLYGFHLFRARSGGGWNRITREAIRPNDDGRYRVADPAVVSGRAYDYRLVARSIEGRDDILGEVRVTIPTVGLDLRVRPNPFNPATALTVDLDRSTDVTLRVFDMTGAAKRTLFRGVLPSGAHNFAWDGRDDAGERLASGVYFARLDAEGETRTLRLVLLQ